MVKSRKHKSTSPVAWHRACLIVATALIAHGLCLGAPFYMDDQEHILNSYRISAAPADAGGILARSWMAVPEGHHAGQRFAAYVLWNALYKITGFNAPAFHALNLLLHALTALLVFLTAHALFQSPHSRLSLKALPPDRAALVAALLFAAHPLASEIPYYAAQTTIALATLFSLLASFCTLRWLQHYEWRWALGAAGSFLLATLSKEPGIFHAGINGLLILLAFTPFHALKERAGKHFNRIAAGAVPLAAAVIFFLFRYGFFTAAFVTISSPKFTGHFLTQSRVFWEYAQRVILPVNLCSDHYLPATVSSADPVAWIAAAALALLLVAVIAAFRRGRRVIALLSCLALAHLLIRFLYLSSEIMVEYRVYPSLPWIAMLGALGISFLFRNAPKRALPVSIAVVILLTLLSVRRGIAWQSENSIVENITRQYPLHIRSHSYLQFKDLNAGRYEAVIKRQVRVQDNLNAILAFNRSDAGRRQYDPGLALAGFMLGEQLAGYALIELGRPADAVGRMTTVIEKMRSFFQNDDSRAFGVLYRARGKAKAALGDKNGARADYEACLHRKPEDTEVLRLLEELEQ